MAQDFILLNSMVKWLHKLLLVAISFSFFISATEVDFGEAHNTFFDEYDTYVKTEQVSFDQVDIQQQQKQEPWETAPFLYYYCGPIRENKSSQQAAYIACNACPLKLYLRNSVWRI